MSEEGRVISSFKLTHSLAGVRALMQGEKEREREREREREEKRRERGILETSLMKMCDIKWYDL